VSFNAKWPLDLATWPGLEAQVAAMADDIAYINHDIDDGMRAELFGVADLRDAPLVGPHVTATVAQFGANLELGRLIGEIVRRFMSVLINDLLSETRRRIAEASPRSAADVRAQNQALAAFSPQMAQQVRALKDFLFARMYRHPKVMGPMDNAKSVVTALFETFSAKPDLLPSDWANSCGTPGDARTVSVVRDYIAGMTDNFALTEYARVVGGDISL
jgi:dGTPase